MKVGRLLSVPDAIAVVAVGVATETAGDRTAHSLPVRTPAPLARFSPLDEAIVRQGRYGGGS
jgi:hypothetical protein